MAYIYPEREVLLSNQSASASGNIAFTSVISSKFSSYMLKIRNLLPASNLTTLRMEFSVDNGANWLAADYWYTFYRYESSLGTGVNGASGTTAFDLIRINSNTASRTASIDVNLFNMNSASINVKYFGTGTYYSSNATALGSSFSGYYNSTVAINAIRLLMSSGNITSGQFYFYGVVED